VTRRQAADITQILADQLCRAAGFGGAPGKPPAVFVARWKKCSTFD
jgi:hypothetical protein